MRPRKILIYMIGSVGDTIVSIPGIRTVRHYFGEDNEYYLFSFKDSGLPFSFDHSFLIRLGLIKEVIYYERPRTFFYGFIYLIRQILNLRGQNFFAVVNLSPSIREKARLVRDQIFFGLAGIKQQVGFLCFPEAYKRPRTLKGETGYAFKESQSKLIRLAFNGIMSSDKLEDLGSIRSEIDGVSSPEAVDWINKNLNPGRKYLAVSPGTKMKSNVWPVERFIELGKKILNHSQFDLIVMGSQIESLSAEKMLKEWGSGLNACGLFDLIGTAKILSRCQIYIGLDSGLAHLAGALNVKNIVISGDRCYPGQWDVLSKNACVRIKHSVECGGCQLMVCDKRYHACMLEIHVDRVWMEYLALQKMVADRAE